MACHRWFVSKDLAKATMLESDMAFGLVRAPRRRRRAEKIQKYGDYWTFSIELNGVYWVIVDSKAVVIGRRWKSFSCGSLCPMGYMYPWFFG